MLNKQSATDALETSSKRIILFFFLLNFYFLFLVIVQHSLTQNKYNNKYIFKKTNVINT